MDTEPLTEDEAALLKQYQVLAAAMPRHAVRLAIEIVPPAVFVAAYFMTAQVAYLLVLIAVMVGYNVQRIVRQRRYILTLNSISRKTLGAAKEKKVE